MVRVWYSGDCQGSVWVIASPRFRLWRRISKANSRETRTGGWNAHAQGEHVRNLFGWTTVVNKNGEIEVYRECVGGNREHVEEGTGRRVD